MAAADLVRLPAGVTFASAPDVLEAAARTVAAGARDIDLSGCTAFDSSLIGVLLELDRRAMAAGGPKCRLLNPPPNLRKLTALYGVDGLLLDQRD